VPLRDVLCASTLVGAELVAGENGLDRVVQRVNVMEVPDILPWVKPDELLLTTGYPLRHASLGLPELVSELNSRRLAGLAIKVGRYVMQIPGEMLDEANRLGFPIMQLPADVSFDDVLNQVLTGILNRQAALLARSDELHRGLVHIVLAGGGLQELASEISRQLAAEVAVKDATRAGDSASTVYTSDDWEAGRSQAYSAAVDIVAGGTVHGSIVARRSSADFDEHDRHILERAATVAALVITRELAVTAVESKYRADFLRDILDGRAGDAKHVLDRGRALGWDLDRPTVVAVARFDDSPVRDDREERRTQERLNQGWIRAVSDVDPTGAVGGFTNHAVAVIGSRSNRTAPETARLAHAALARSLRESKRVWTTGLSRVVYRVEDLPNAYLEASRAADAGAQFHGSASITSFQELGALRLLSLIHDPGELREFVHETLKELAGNEPEAVELRHTLNVLLETSLNVAESARRLHFHYNTMRYRVEKLERILGPFIEDARLRLDLALAMRILDMQGTRPATVG
jgi:purine catabolism regulator